MKFENRGKWLKEAEDKLAAYNTQEHPDYLDGDNKVCTFEDDEIINFEKDDLDVIEEDDTLDSPEEEEDAIAMSESMPPMGQRKRIEFEDDIVRVYDGNKEIYAGAEDYEPMQDEDWKWDNANKYYKFDKYIKVCCESSQKNEFDANSERTLIAKKKEIQKLVAKMGNDNLVQYISLLKTYVDDAYDYALKHFDESSQKNEDLGTYAVAWREFDRQDRIIGKQKEFKTASARDSFIKKIQEHPRFYEIVATSDPENESSQKNEGPEEFKDNKYERDFFEYKNGGHGDFMEYLAKACMQADKKNLAKIQKEFPELTRAFCLWKSSGKTDKAEKL